MFLFTFRLYITIHIINNYQYYFILYRNKNTKLDSIKKQIDLSNNISNEWQNKLAMHKNQMNTEMNEVQLYREKDIAPLLNLHNQLLR